MKIFKNIQRKSIIFRLLPVGILLCCSVSVFSYTPSSETITDLIETYVSDYNLSGLAVVVTKGDEVIYKGSHGRKLAVSPFETTDRSYIASVSKPMTATAILLLAEEGAIDLDASITAYLRDFTLSDGRQDEIIIRNLLNHTSGLSSRTYRYKNDPAHSSRDFYRDIQNASLASEPGAEFSYSNEGYNLLGVLIESVSGQSYAEFMERRLFQPLGMNSTSTIGKDDVLIDGYTSMLGLTIGRKEIAYKAEAPSGFIISSALDVSKFLRFQLTGLDANGNVLLSKESLDEMHGAISRVKDYSLGWMAYDFQGMEGHRHPGDVNNFASQALFIPESEVTVTILANKNHLVYSVGVYNMMADALVASMHGLEYRPAAWLKWIILLYPLIILLDLVSSVMDTIKIRKKYLKAEKVDKQKMFKTLFSSAAILFFIMLGIPMIISLLMNRGVSYNMIWAIAPDLLILMLISAAFKLLHVILIGYKLYKIRGLAEVPVKTGHPQTKVPSKRRYSDL